MNHFVYILRSDKDGRKYIGSTADVHKRLLWHNSGKNASTRYRMPLRVIYQKEFSTKSEAIKYEMWLKKQKGGYKIKALIEQYNAPIAHW